MACSRPFYLLSFSPAARVPDSPLAAAKAASRSQRPGPSLLRMYQLPAHCSCCRCAMSTRREKKWTRTRAATLAVVLPHPRPGDLAAVGIRDGRARETARRARKLPRVVWHSGPPCLIDNRFPSLASPTTATYTAVCFATRKKIAVEISHHVMYVHSFAPFVRPVALLVNAGTWSHPTH